MALVEVIRCEYVDETYIEKITDDNFFTNPPAVQTQRAYHVEGTSTLEVGKSVLFAQHIAWCTSPKMIMRVW